MVLIREFIIIIRFAKHRRRLVHYQQVICTCKYKVKCDIYLISYLVSKFRYVWMKFKIIELLYGRICTVYDCRVNLSHILFVLHQICLINRNLTINLYLNSWKSFLFCHISTQERKLYLLPNRSHKRYIIATRQYPLRIQKGLSSRFWKILSFFSIVKG